MEIEKSAAETEALGAELAERLAPGDVVVVSGEVGAGKTTLIRGACRALGIEEPVTSPTFTIGQRYGGGRLPVSHLDLYRLEEPRRRGPGPARRLPRARRRRLRRVAGGGASAARPTGESWSPARARRRRQAARSTVSAASAGARRVRERDATCSIGRNCDPRREGRR